MSLLVICEILGLSVNTFTADGKYFLCNNENLPQEIEMQLSKKQITFSKFFLSFLKTTTIYKYFVKKKKKKKKMTLIAHVFPELRIPKHMVDKCAESPVSEQPSIVNMLKGPKR